MSELSDYRRFVEAPMIRSYEATIEAQAVEISSLRGHLKDWQDSSEAYRIDCETAIARAKTAEQRVKELQGQLDDFLDPTLKSFRLEDGRFDMSLAGDVVQRVALVLTTWFRESDAKNYVEIRINAKDAPFESYVFNVQKVGDGGKTPHELRETAEQERDQAREALKPFAEAWVWSCEFNVSVQSHIKVEDFRRAARAITGKD